MSMQVLLRGPIRRIEHDVLAAVVRPVVPPIGF